MRPARDRGHAVRPPSCAAESGSDSLLSTLISRGFTGAAAAALALGLAAPHAHAGPYSEVPSAFDEGDDFDLNLRLDYSLDVRRGKIQRENVGEAGTTADDPIPLDDDLSYAGTRHTLTPEMQMGLFHDTWVSVGLPIVIRDTRSLSLDVDRSASSTIRDGLLPQNGFDSHDPTGPGFTSGKRIFRGPTRAGLDQVYLGLGVAPMNQERDDTKPTWKLQAEVRIPIGTVQSFDRMDPEGDTGVGRGLWEVNLSTSIAKQLTWAEPYVELWWRAPFKQTKDSHFDDLGFGSRRTAAQQQAGTRFGFDAFLLNKPKDHQRVSLQFEASLVGQFEGRAYTEMWEIFQYAGDARVGGPLVLDKDPLTAGVQAASYPGVSNVENYLSMGGLVGIQAELGEKVRFGAGFQLTHDQSHIISFADAGRDKPTCSGSAQPPDCEVMSNDVVDPGTDEVNPHYAETIDLVGRRYRLDGATDYTFLVDARLLF